VQAEEMLRTGKVAVPAGAGLISFDLSNASVELPDVSHQTAVGGWSSFKPSVLLLVSGCLG